MTKSTTPMLDLLEEEHIFSVAAHTDGTFTLEEGCDNYFCVKLTYDQLRQLSEELSRLATSAEISQLPI